MIKRENKPVKISRGRELFLGVRLGVSILNNNFTFLGAQPDSKKIKISF